MWHFEKGMMFDLEISGQTMPRHNIHATSTITNRSSQNGKAVDCLIFYLLQDDRIITWLSE